VWSKQGILLWEEVLEDAEIEEAVVGVFGGWGRGSTIGSVWVIG
jgi:hypothetical protein